MRGNVGWRFLSDVLGQEFQNYLRGCLLGQSPLSHTVHKAHKVQRTSNTSDMGRARLVTVRTYRQTQKERIINNIILYCRIE